MLAIADQIGLLNEAQLNAGRQKVERTFRQSRNRLALTFGLTVGLGLMLAAFSIRQTLKLEREAADRYKEIVDARAELKQFSARLVHAQEDERRSISRELHDEVGQSMSACWWSHLLATPPEAARDLLTHQINGLRETAIRKSVRNLSSPAALHARRSRSGAGVAGRRGKFREAGMCVDVAADEICDELADEYKTCIYRIVQEALHNIIRHAEAHVGQARR